MIHSDRYQDQGAERDPPRCHLQSGELDRLTPLGIKQVSQAYTQEPRSESRVSWQVFHLVNDKSENKGHLHPYIYFGKIVKYVVWQIPN